jgi:hypothetical protein
MDGAHRGCNGCRIFELTGREMTRTIVFGNPKVSRQSRHEARQPYGLELPGLVRFDLAGATGIQLVVPTLPRLRFSELLPKEARSIYL